MILFIVSIKLETKNKECLLFQFYEIDSVYLSSYKVKKCLLKSGKVISTRHDSPDELKRGSFHLLPYYGTILPSARATFCHCLAQNDASGEKFREVYHRHS